MENKKYPKEEQLFILFYFNLVQFKKDSVTVSTNEIYQPKEISESLAKFLIESDCLFYQYLVFMKTIWLEPSHEILRYLYRGHKMKKKIITRGALLRIVWEMILSMRTEVVTDIALGRNKSFQVFRSRLHNLRSAINSHPTSSYNLR